MIRSPYKAPTVVLPNPYLGIEFTKDAGTILLLHFDGSSGSTSIYDKVSATDLQSNGVVLDGGGSAQFGSSTSPIVLPTSGFNNSSFTAEFIITTKTENGAILLGGGWAWNGVLATCTINQGWGVMAVQLSNNQFYVTGSSIPVGSHHIAFTKYLGSLYFHLDGIQVGSTQNCSNISVNFNEGCVGALRGSNSQVFDAIMHECRITNYARYTTPTITVV